MLIKPFDPLHLLATVKQARRYRPLETSRGSKGRTADIMRLIEIGQRQHELLTDSYRQILESLLDALESRDAETSAHSRACQRLRDAAHARARPSLLDDPTLEWGFLLHDIGKIGIPDEILLKPGPLDSAERAIHREASADRPPARRAYSVRPGRGIEVIRSHHERWDGLGYPDGLKGDRDPARPRASSPSPTRSTR